MRGSPHCQRGLDKENEEEHMHFDAVFWGSIISVIIAIVIFVYLGFKVVKLMNEDAERNKSGGEQP
jgi:ABC-type phosphate transport system permease subunit